MSDLGRLKDAGFREQRFAQRLVDEGKLPVGVDYAAMLDHGLYDAHRDEVVLSVKGAVLRWRVTVP